jgi:NADH:ubiquinone reductase (H+-translocating)
VASDHSGRRFGGLRAAQTLTSDLFDVTLIDRRNHHLYQPLLGQVATGSLSPGQISAPLRSVLAKQKNTRVLLGSVEDVDPEAKKVFLAEGAALAYDSLIVATGSETSYFGNHQWQEWAPALKSVEEATLVHHKVLYVFEVGERTLDPVDRRAWLTFVIVGAGPTGVELSGAIAEVARQTLKKDSRSIRPEESRVILLNRAPRVLMAFPEDLAQKATRSLVNHGLTVNCGVTVKDINKEGLTIESQDYVEHIAAKTVIWAGGIAPSPLGKILARRANADTDKAGRIKVKADLTVSNYPDIYIDGSRSRCGCQSQTFAGSVAGGRAGRAVRGQGDRAESNRSARTPSLSVPRPRLTGGDWTLGGSGQCVWSSSLRAPCLDRVGLHTRDEPRELPKSVLGLLPSDPRLDPQSWSAVHHRYRAYGLQL